MERNLLTKSATFFIILILLETSLVSCSGNIGYSSDRDVYINAKNTSYVHSIIQGNLDQDLNHNNNPTSSAAFWIDVAGGLGFSVSLSNSGDPVTNVSFNVTISEGLFHPVTLANDVFFKYFDHGELFIYWRPIAGILMPIFVKISVTADYTPTILRNYSGFVFMFFVFIKNIS